MTTLSNVGRQDVLLRIVGCAAARSLTRAKAGQLRPALAEKEEEGWSSSPTELRTLGGRWSSGSRGRPSGHRPDHSAGPGHPAPYR